MQNLTVVASGVCFLCCLAGAQPDGEPASVSAETLQPKSAEFPYKNRPLRDPFWDVGYYPPQWGEHLKPKQVVTDSEWFLPTQKLEVSGVSRMGSKVMAIVNSDLKQVGDIVEITHLGKTFQWKISEIQTDGNVRFERHDIIINQ